MKLFETKVFFTESSAEKVDYITTSFFNIIKKRASENVVIITRNKNLETNLKNRLIQESGNLPLKLNIFSFKSFISKIISENWSYLYNYPPKLLGFYDTNLYLKEFIINKHPLFEQEIKDKAFIIKLFERYQRLSDNNIEFLNDKNSKKYDAFLKSFSDFLLNREIPLLDYSLQLKSVLELLKNKEFFSKFSLEYKYWIVDGIEEATYAEQLFYEKFNTLVQGFTYVSNPYGGVREFLGANPTYLDTLKDNFKTEYSKKLETPFSTVGNKLFNIINTEEFYSLAETTYDENFFEYHNLKSYSEMLEKVDFLIKQIKTMDNNSEIVVISNSIDDLLESELLLIAEKNSYSFESIRGTEVFIKKSSIRAITTILRIIFDEEINEFESFPNLKPLDFSQLLFFVAHIDNFKLAELRKKLRNNTELWKTFISKNSNNPYVRHSHDNDPKHNLSNINDAINYGIEKKGLLNKKENYLELITYIWNKIFEDDKKLIGSQDLTKLLKACGSYIEVAQTFFKGQNFIHFLKEIVSGDFSNSPDLCLEKKTSNIKLITLQKLSESNYESNYQIWIDITSEKWLKKDSHEIFNPYSFSLQVRGENTTDYESLINMEFSRKVKIAFNLCQKKLFMTSSLYNVMGQRNDYDLFKSFFG